MNLLSLLCTGAPNSGNRECAPLHTARVTTECIGLQFVANGVCVCVPMRLCVQVSSSGTLIRDNRLVLNGGTAKPCAL
jgi:hypothetical protein